MTRCPTCYRPLDAAHRLLGRCLLTEPAATAQRRSQRGYVPPSRRARVPRDDYLASIRLTEDQRKAASRASSAAYRARKRAA